MKRKQKKKKENQTESGLAAQGAKSFFIGLLGIIVITIIFIIFIAIFIKGTLSGWF